MRLQGFFFICDEVRNFIGVSSLDHSSMEKFGVALSFLEPMDT